MDKSSFCLSFLRRASLFKDVLVAILVGITLMMPCYAGIPDWWIGRQVVRAEVTDDVHAALNAGQLKHAVKQAVQEMNAKLTGGAGTDLNGLVAGWGLEGSQVDNYEMINAGQLKEVLKKFYDRMNVVHGTTGYPWPATGTTDYFEAVNVGQLKKLLRVDVSLAWNQNLAQGFGTTAGPVLTAPSGDLGNQSGILAAADHYLKNQLLNLAARGGNPIAIPTNPEAIENAPVATTAGEFKVGQDGAANYSIRIQGPKGVANVEPIISLDYNSNSGNSIMGLGWNLSGLLVINRGPTSVEVDGYFDPADFDANDRFYLDGDRLICVAGIYGADGSEYRTLKEQLSRVIYHKSASEDWFEVQTKSGLKLEFGHDNTSSIGPMENGQWSQHPKLTWAVNKVSDSLGNYWQAQYADLSQGGDAGEDTPYLPDYQPSSIRYTGHTGLNRDPMHEIRFIYEERPDQNRDYLMGFLVRKSRRLCGIEISTLGTVLKSYKFKYQMDSSFVANHGERSMLKSMQEIAGPLSDPNAPRLPATVFDWEEGQRTWQGSDKQPEVAEVIQKIDYSGGVPTGELDDLRLEYNAGHLHQGSALWFSKQPAFVDLDGDGVNEIFINHRGLYWVDGMNQNFERNEFRQIFKIKPGSLNEWSVASPLPVERSTAFKTSMWSNSFWSQISYNISQFSATPAPTQSISETQFPYLTTAAGVPTGATLMDVNADGLVDIVSAGSFDELHIDYDDYYQVVAGSDLENITNASGIWLNTGGAFEKVINGDWDFPLVPTEIIATPGGAIQTRPAILPAGMIASSSGPHEEMKQPEFAEFKENDLGWRVVDMDGDGFSDIIRAGQGKNQSGWATSTTVSTPIATGTGALSTAGRELCFGLRNKGPDAPAGQRWELINPDPNTNSIWKLPLPLVDDNGKLDMGRRLLDMNGDGLPDFVAQKKRVVPYPNATFPAYSYDEYDIEVWLNRGAAGWEHQGPENGQANPWTLEGMVLAYGMLNIDMEYGRMLQDMNGDGLPDFVVSFEVNAGYTQKAVFLNTGSGWVKKDGGAINFTNLAPPEYLFFNSVALTSTRPYLLMDMTGDGRPEFLNSYDTDAMSLPGSANKVGLTQFMGMNGTWTSSSVERAATDWNIPDELLATFIPATQYTPSEYFAPLNFAELDGDGVTDVLRSERNVTSVPIASRTYFRRGLTKPPRITQITNGLGVPIVITYGQLPALAAATVNGVPDPMRRYRPGETLSSYPYVNGTPAWTVVTDYTTFDGSENADGSGGGSITTSYFYAGLRFHALKGSLGFEKIETRSTLSPVRQETTLSQAEDSIGLPLGSESFIINDQGQRQLISRTVAIYGAMNLNHSLEAPNHYSRFAFAHVVTKENWSPEGAYLGKASSESSYWQWGPLGGLLDSQVVVLDQGTPGDQTDDTISAINHEYDDPVTTAGEWRIGQISSTTVDSSAPGTPSVSNRSEFDYYPSGHVSAGLLKEETINANSLPVTKTHGYDASGNEVKIVTTAEDMPPVVSETWFDPSGRFPLASVNALGHAVRTTYDVQLSLATAQYMAFASDAPNADPTAHSPQIPVPPSGHPITATTYDPWSTSKITTGPDGLRSVRFTQLFSDASLPKCLYYVYEQAEGSPPVITYYDRYHRALMVEKTGFNGEVIFQESQLELIFNASGQKTGSQKRSSQPYFAGGQLPGYAVEEYDAYDRKTKVTAPDGSWTKVAYNGFKATMTNHRGQTQERVVDQSGHNIESKDTDGNKVIFAYTADGQPRLATTVYAENASPSTTITTTYNAQRLKETVTDPNTGTSETYYDAYGRVTESLDSRGSLTVTRYDALGRVVRTKTGVTNFFQNINTITQFETDTQWVYDFGSTATSNGLGKPKSVTFTHKDGASTRTAMELYTYDALGRSVSTTATLAGQVAFNGSYTSSTSYHPSAAPGYGRVDTVTDPGSYTRAGFYNAHGFLSEVHEGSATGAMLWRGMLYDAEGKMLTEHHGNGIGTTSRYHPTRGFTECSLTYRWTTNAPIQDLKMRINDMGNVEWRQLTRYESVAAGVSLPEPEIKTETFGFDSQNRLTSSHVVGHDTQSFSFEVNGNIQTKSGIGTYGYGQRGHGPHAVTSVTLGTEVQRSYSYDAKGRMLKEFVGDVTNEATQTALREIAYTSFDQPSFIQHWGAAALSSDLGALDDGQSAWDQLCTLNFYFGPGMQRLIQTKHKGLLATKVLSLGGYEIRETTSGTLAGTLIEREERSSFGNGSRVKRWTAASPNVPVISYEFAVEDHLGSGSATFDGAGQLHEQRGDLKNGTEVQKTEHQSYDAWGARRDGETWAPAAGQQGAGAANSGERLGSNLPRGYTGHEMLDDVGLIHMNGRLYDAALGRMCMADPYVQSPANPQNHNRYSYVLNNPLSATDPSGNESDDIYELPEIVIYGSTTMGLSPGDFYALSGMQQFGAPSSMQYVMQGPSAIYGQQPRPPLLAAANKNSQSPNTQQVTIESGYFDVVLNDAAFEAVAIATAKSVEPIGNEVHAAAHGAPGGDMTEAQGGGFRDGANSSSWDRFSEGFSKGFTFNNFIKGAAVGALLTLASPAVLLTVAVVGASAAIYQVASADDVAGTLGEMAGAGLAGGIGGGGTSAMFSRGAARSMQTAAANSAVPQVLQNQAQGALGEAAVRARLLNSNRLELVGEQIRVSTPGVGSYRVTDFLVRSLKTDRLSIIEVKTGWATRDATQLAKDALIADPLAPTTFTGNRAAAVGFPGGTPTGPIRTFEVNASNLNR